MKNYCAKIPLGPGKYCYQQTENFRIGGYEIVDAIRCRWPTPKHFFHLRRGGHVAAARLHVGSTEFFKMDLSTFFTTVSKNKIVKALKRIGFDFETAREISIESTVSEGGRPFLPFGFVQSPIIASVVLDRSALGSRLRALPKLIRRSVYVDDIILSSVQDAKVIDEASEEVLTAASEARFGINEEKTVRSSGCLRAFNLDIGADRIEVSNERICLFRERIAMGATDEQVGGIERYVNYVNPAQVSDLFR